MKIYHKKYFAWGIIFLIPLPLFISGVIKADLWQWVLSIGLSAKFLFAGLSKHEGEHQKNIEKNYQRVSQELFGKYAGIKTNLPWVVMGVFFTGSLFVRYLLDIVIPVWIAVFFVIILAISVFYSLNLNQKIIKQIDKETNSNGKPIR